MTCMKSFLKTTLTGLLWLLGTLAALPACATILSITPTPGNTRVPLGGSTSVAITWNVLTVNGPFVSSPSGTFRTNVTGPILGTVTRLLTKPAAPAGTSSVTFTEVILVPMDVIYRAHKLGVTSFGYFRDFQDGSGFFGTPQSVTLNITTASVAGFSLSRLALLFDNGAPVRLLGLKEPLHALAEINFTGSGLVQAVWEVAGPSSTAGQPVYRPLTSVRQYLVGGDKQVLRSPDLPTHSSGFYLVQLRITDPAPGFEQPVLRYFVSSGKPGEVLPIMPMGLVAPARLALLAPDTLFAWEPIRAARAYQLEIYARAPTPGDMLPDLGDETTIATPTLPDTPAVTGMLVPGGQTRTALSSVSRSHLQAGRHYLWRVLAIGGDGNIVGASPVREIRLP